jgi:syntaxin 7
MLQQLMNKFKTEEPVKEQIQIQPLQEPKIIFENDINFQNVIIEERDKEIRELSKQFIEINEMMGTISTLVSQQGEIVDNIFTNIEDSKNNVDDAKKDLHEAEESQKTGNKIAWWVAIATAVSVLTGGSIVIAVV